jgi:NAD(P)H-flavin reductase
VAIVGPEGSSGSSPDLPALIRLLRQTMPEGPAAATRTGRTDPLAKLFADGPSPGAQPALPALQQVLRDSLTRAGGPEELARRLVVELARSPEARSATPALSADLRALLPAGPTAQREALARAVGWLVDNLNRPQAVTAGLAQLGPAAAALGVPPERMEALAVLLADALRASGWLPEQQAAWQMVARLAGRWAAQGAAAGAYEPPTWIGTVVEHDLRRQDLAVLLVRTYLPYPYLPGQHAVVESAHHRADWRACWLATPPATDNLVELHVRAGPADPVGTALVGRVRPGDHVRLRPAEGPLVLDAESDAGLLLIADDTGVAPMRALLGELSMRGDRRAARLLWLAALDEEPYDLTALTRLVDDAAADGASGLQRMAKTIDVLSGMADLLSALAAGGPWADWDAYVAGTPTGVAGALTALAYAGIPAERIRCDQIGPDD